MMRRVIAAAALVALPLVLIVAPAGADLYPPAPPAPKVSAPKAQIVIVRGAPRPSRAVLSRTGTSSTLPLVALGGGFLAVGVLLVSVTAGRREVAVSRRTRRA